MTFCKAINGEGCRKSKTRVRRRLNRSNFLLWRTRSKRRIRNLINNASLIIVHGRSKVVQYYSISVLLDNWGWLVRMTILCNVRRYNPLRVYLHSTHQPIFSPFTLFSLWVRPSDIMSIVWFFFHSFYNRRVFSPNFIISRHYPPDAYTYIYRYRYAWLNNNLSVGIWTHNNNIIMTCSYKHNAIK